MINFHNTDNMKFMADVPDKYYDLAIVDPPYGIGVETRVFKNDKKWDNEIPSEKYFSELFRISQNQIIWGGNYFLDHLPATPCFIIWDKKMTDKHLMSMSEFAWTSFKSKNLIFRQPPVGDRGFYNIDGTRIHPTQKSIALYEWLLSKYAKPNDKIIDTHGGSGSIAIAVDKANTLDNTNYSLDIIELDKDYFKDSVNRFNQYKSQQTIQF